MHFTRRHRGVVTLFLTLIVVLIVVSLLLLAGVGPNTR
jgi:hypothetical protein